MKIPTDTYKVDLHVHSPASLDYEGLRGARGYAALANSFVEADVAAILITDHNTISGYLDYQHHAKKARELLDLMIERDDSQSNLCSLKSEVDCYNRLQVLPGVEVSVYPNVHIILVFDPLVVADVNDFLRTDMELGEAVDNGNPTVKSKHSVLVLLDKATARFGDKFFCILPHVESTKGVWQELDRSARADIVKDDRILAAQFSNPDTIDVINQVMSNPQYKRSTPLAFIQASDYHGSPNVKPASAYSIFDVAHPFTFESLRAVLSNPSCVRNCFEYVDEQLKDYVSGYEMLNFDFSNNLELTAERELEMSKALCSLMNTSNTVLQLNLRNVTETINKGGDVVASLVREWVKKLDPPEVSNFQVAQFHQTSSRQRFCIKVTRNIKLRLFESICWICDKGRVRPARSWEIEHLVSRNSYMRFGKVNQDSLVAASTQILRVSSSFPAIPIATRLQQLVSKDRMVQLKETLLKPVFSPEIGDDLGFNNGFADGDYYMYEPKLGLKGGRLGSQRDYFRFTAPVFPYHDRQKLDTANAIENSLLVVWGGGVNVILKSKPLYSAFPVMMLTLENEFENSQKLESCLYGVAAWLKSSFVLWYITAVYQTDNLLEVLMNDRKIPLPNDLAVLTELGALAQKVSSSETEFLRVAAKERPSEKELEKVMEILLKHNNTIQELMKRIDLTVLRYLGATKQEITEIYRVLRDLDLYDYGISTELNSFIKEVGAK